MNTIKSVLQIILILLGYVGVGAVCYLAGVDNGRAEYHKDLINEMEANGDAPVLLYKNEPRP